MKKLLFKNIKIALYLLTITTLHGLNAITTREQTNTFLSTRKNSDLKVIDAQLQKLINIMSTCAENSLHSIAVNPNKKDIIPFLIKKNLKKTDYLPLPYATYYEDIKTVQFLIERDLNIDAQDILGNTVLHNAILQNYTDIALFLIGKGANLNLQNNYGDSPLHVAFKMSNTNIAECLMEFYANVNLQDNYGDTPLHVAIFTKNRR